jgi:hypothetical protein
MSCRLGLAATASFTGTYTGQGSNATTCNTSFNINGQEPTDGNRHPVFLYIVGTTETSTDASASAAVTGMANRGFVAATIQYDSGSFGNCSQIGGKAQCIFNSNSNPSRLACCVRGPQPTAARASLSPASAKAR